MSNRYGITTLCVDKQTVEVDGIEYTVTVEYDQDHSMVDGDDGDWCGTFAFPPRRRNDWGYEERPDHMDGGAIKLHVGQSYDTIWWQPPKDYEYPRSSPEFKAFRDNVVELLTWGFVGIIVEDQFGHEAALWGIGSMDHDYQGEVVCDLIDECVAQQKRMIGALS